MAVIDRLDDSRWKAMVAIFLVTVLSLVVITLGGTWFVYHNIHKANEIERQTNTVVSKQIPALQTTISKNQQTISALDGQLRVAVGNMLLLEKTLTANGITVPPLGAVTIPPVSNPTAANNPAQSAPSHTKANSPPSTTTAPQHATTTTRPRTSTTTTTRPIASVSIPSVTIVIPQASTLLKYPFMGANYNDFFAF